MNQSLRFLAFILFSLALHLSLVLVRTQHVQIANVLTKQGIFIVERSPREFMPTQQHADANSRTSNIEDSRMHSKRNPLRPKDSEPVRTEPENKSQPALIAENAPAVLNLPEPKQTNLDAITSVEWAENLDAELLSSMDSSEVLFWKERSSSSQHVQVDVALNSPAGNPDQDIQKALPRYDVNPLPEYPEVARNHHYEGTVKLEVLVTADGKVSEIKILKSSGFRSLDQAARRSVRFWEFIPATSFGGPVESRIVVPINFILDDQ